VTVCLVRSAAQVLIIKPTQEHKHYNKWTLKQHIKTKYKLIHSLILQSVPQQIRSLFQRVQSSVSLFSFQYPFFSFKSSSSCLCFLPLLPATYIFPSIFTLIMCLRKQYLRQIWPIQVTWLLFACRIILFWLTCGNTYFSHGRSIWSIFLSNTTWSVGTERQTLKTLINALEDATD
jgi:hypothetical protein